MQRVLGSRKQRTLVRSGRLLLFSPSIKGKTFVYTRTDARRSRVMIRRTNKPGTGKVLYSLKRTRASLGSTAISERFAYVTVFDPGAPQAALVADPEAPPEVGQAPEAAPPPARRRQPPPLARQRGGVNARSGGSG